ncbi:MAG: hypothetical protein JWM80_557 [Cyanobacteria bacterium RYN_339]|nr:hypothetical protein [Cyanobacteria bacterium RYN_339]
MRSPRHLGSALLLAALAGGVGITALPQSAEACGGLFCSRQRVDQAGEKILFATDGENVTAYVQIQYTGEAKDFSWIVPVPTEPQVSLGSDALFTALRATSRPQFCIKVEDKGNCKQEAFLTAPSAASADGAGMVSAKAPGVNVLQQQQLGAFEMAVIQSNDPGALKAWLKANDYVLPDKLDPLLDPYVAGKYDFVAVKLQKNASAGDIQPIVMKYKSTKPGIPIRLTGIAATADMDVYCWVLGKNRAIPENYRHAIINEARIDWLNYAPTNLNDNRYRETVTEAMNEAGGQAFVTDYAGDSKNVDISAFTPERYAGVDGLLGTKDPIAFAKAVVNGGYFDPVPVNPNGPACPPGYTSTGGSGGFFFGGGANIGPVAQIAPGAMIDVVSPDGSQVEYLNVNPQSLSFLKRFIPMPASLVAKGVQDYDFYPQMGQYKAELAQTTVDTAAAVKAIREQVITPQSDIKAIFGNNPYLTALYTTMSPEEMTQDPTFIFNKDLPKVASMHLATGVRQCSTDYTFDEAPVQITLANGLKYTVARNLGAGVGIINSGTPVPGVVPKPVKMPAADRIEQLKSSGLASLITDNRDIIQQALGIIRGSTVTVGGQTFGFDTSGQVVAIPGPKGKTTSSAAGGFGCAGCSNSAAPTKQGASEGFTYALVVVGFLGYRRWLGRKH